MATTMDSLTTLLDQYTLRAGAFFAGNLCGHHGFPDDVGRGHLHVIRSGRVRILGIQKNDIVIDSPTLLFLTRPGAHRLAVDSEAGSDMVCGTVQLGLGGWNPVTSALPDVIVVPLADLPDLDGLLATLFAEAFGQGIGRQAVLDRCCEIVAVRLMRHGFGLPGQGESMLGLPADFLIAPDGRVLAAHYGSHADDQWSLDELLALARTHAPSKD